MPQEDINLNYGELKKRGFMELFDCDFHFFKCPSCQKIYLFEAECDTIFLEPCNSHNLIAGYLFENCVKCGYKFHNNRALIGSNADGKLKVSQQEVLDSSWNWVILPEDCQDEFTL